jgi:probable rRNA maturation factor
VIEVEARGRPDVDAAPLEARLRWACERLGLTRASLGLLVVGPQEMARINAEHRGKPEPTDVLAFPVDQSADSAGPREIGDVVLCPKRARDLEEAVIHGVLHLAGHDHETDRGEMLALQRRVLAELRARR